MSVDPGTVRRKSHSALELPSIEPMQKYKLERITDAEGAPRRGRRHVVEMRRPRLDAVGCCRRGLDAEALPRRGRSLYGCGGYASTRKYAQERVTDAEATPRRGKWCRLDVSRFVQ